MVVDFNVLNYNSIENRIYFLRYVLEKELDIVLLKGNKSVSNSGDKYVSDFYRDSIKLLDIYLKFMNKKSYDKLSFSSYSLCTLHTTLYNKNYSIYLDKYLKDSDLSMDFIVKYLKNNDSLLLNSADSSDSVKEEEIDVVHLSNKNGL